MNVGNQGGRLAADAAKKAGPLPNLQCLSLRRGLPRFIGTQIHNTPEEKVLTMRDSPHQRRRIKKAPAAWGSGRGLAWVAPGSGQQR